MKKRPNILFALADDASHFGIYGHDFVSTPNIDWLGRNGVVFDNAFTPNPKCAPSRASILTGRYPWQNESACNHWSVFPENMTLYPDLLEAAGYHIGYTGKGWGPGKYDCSGYTRNPAGPEYNDRKLKPPAGTQIRSFDYAENFRDFLDCREKDQPFYFWYGGCEPHRPYTFGESLRAGKNTEQIKKLPAYWPDTETVRTDFLDYASEIEWFDMHLGQMIETLREHCELDNTLIVVTSDNGCPFPRVKGQLYEQDFHLPMVGCWMDRLKAGRHVAEMINFVDIAPTFLEAAGVAIPDTVTGRSFLGAFTGMEKLGGDWTAAYFGREKHDLGRANELGYPVRCIRTERYLYKRNFSPERWPCGNPETGYRNCDDSPTKALILQRHAMGADEHYYHLCFGKRPGDELFDIQKDPECMNNLAYDPEYEQLKNDLWKKLRDFLLRTNDPRITVDPDYFEQFECFANEPDSWANFMLKMSDKRHLMK